MGQCIQHRLLKIFARHGRRSFRDQAGAQQRPGSDRPQTQRRFEQKIAPIPLFVQGIKFGGMEPKWVVVMGGHMFVLKFREVEKVEAAAAFLTKI
jgi:hypothetical protein